MFTIEIPEWLQWAGVALAIAYAVPKALRAGIVAVTWLFSLLGGWWVVPEPQRDGTRHVKAGRLLRDSDKNYERVLNWAFQAPLIGDEDEDPEAWPYA